MRFLKAFIPMLSLALISSITLADCGNSTSVQEIIESKMDTLVGSFSVSELQRDRMITIRETGEVLPFGYISEEWEELKSLMQDGDEIYFVEHRDGYYMHNGHLLVRAGCVVFFLRGAIS